MSNTYLSQGDVVRITTYEVLCRYFSEASAACVLPPHLAWVRDMKSVPSSPVHWHEEPGPEKP